MKGFLPYLIMFIVTTVAASVVFLLIALVSPDTLAPPGSTTAVKNSSKAQLMAPDSTRRDTTFAHADSTMGADTVGAIVGDSALAGQMPDSIHQVGQLSADTSGTAHPLAREDSARTQEQKSLAKVFESMEPEKAAAILKNLSDEEIRTTILVLKRRQAARILAALDPDRVAKIIR